MEKITEKSSQYRFLEKMSTAELVNKINKEDQSVAQSVSKVLLDVEKVVDCIVKKIAAGGRLFYIGSGTSGRLGILDASECPPTFGVNANTVIGLIAGGDAAIRTAQEFAEDEIDLAWKDLTAYQICEKDIVLGISASGSTPYVLHGLKNAQQNGITTACLVNNPNSSIAKYSDFSIEVITGPEFLTASTRMKAGTAQKMILNMISTATMIKLGYVEDNKMVDMQLSNEKLLDRGTKMIMEKQALDYKTARAKLEKFGSVRKALAFSEKVKKVNA